MPVQQWKPEHQTRFSDLQLIEMREDLTDLSNRFTRHEEEESKKFDAMISAVNQNTSSIDRLTTETRAIVELHRDLQGTVRVGRGVQKFVSWLIKLSFIGAVSASVLKFFNVDSIF